MSSYCWTMNQISNVNSLWFRPLQPTREDLSLRMFEEILEKERRQCIDKGASLPVYGRSELDNPDDDEDADEAEEESDGGEADDELDAQQGTVPPIPPVDTVATNTTTDT